MNIILKEEVYFKLLNEHGKMKVALSSRQKVGVFQIYESCRVMLELITSKQSWEEV